jgi:hypothetical protein
MQIGVMTTDHGPHPAEKWAEQTAAQIVQISETAPEAKLAEAREFQRKVTAALTGHHQLVQDRERDHLRTKGAARHADHLDPSEHLDDAIDAIVAAAKGTSFAAHFARPEVLGYLRQTVGGHFATAMHIERLWHGDDGDAADAHRARHGLTKATGPQVAAYRAKHGNPKQGA